MRAYWDKRPVASKTNPHWRTPDQLWDEAVKYFEWATEFPLEEHKIVTAGTRVHHLNLNRPRAFTITGLCAYLGVRPSVFNAYAEKEKFAYVVEAIKTVIATQKFEYAAVGMLNAALISRDLGLADKQEHSGPNGGPIQHENALTDDAAAALNAIASRLAGSSSTSEMAGEGSSEPDTPA